MQGEIAVPGGAPSSLPANVTVISIHPFHELADPLSRKAFAGAPVELWLIDDKLEPRAKLTWETR